MCKFPICGEKSFQKFKLSEEKNQPYGSQTVISYKSEQCRDILFINTEKQEGSEAEMS